MCHVAVRLARIRSGDLRAWSPIVKPAHKWSRACVVEVLERDQETTARWYETAVINLGF